MMTITTPVSLSRIQGPSLDMATTMVRRAHDVVGKLKREVEGLDVNDALKVLNDPTRHPVSILGDLNDAGHASVEAATYYSSARNGWLTGGASQHRMAFRLLRPIAGHQSSNTSFESVEDDPDEFVKTFLPKLFDQLGVAYDYSGITTANAYGWCDFRWVINLMIQSQHSYNGQVQLTLSVARDIGGAGSRLLAEVPFSLEIRCDGMANNQPTLKEGEEYWDGDSLRTAAKNIFSDYCYHFPDELGFDAITQTVANLIQWGFLKAK